MTKSISNAEMRERMLERFDAARQAAVDWRTAIGQAGNRQLLALIAATRPASVAELASLAGRAQPNVSRALATLVRAGLVELRSNGRISVPTLTELGEDKVAALELVAPAAPEAEPAADLCDLVRATIESDGPGDAVLGHLFVQLRLQATGQAAVARRRDDLNELANRWLGDWWRLLYRRDAPYKLCEASIAGAGGGEEISLLVTSMGGAVSLSGRSCRGSGIVGHARDRVALATFAQALRVHVAEPVARRLTSRGRLDRPLHALLARLAEADREPALATVWQTAGALGVSPYCLDDATARQIYALIDLLPEDAPRLDFASAVLTEGLAASTRWVEGEVATHGDGNRLPGLVELASRCRLGAADNGLRPWERGLALARQVRAACNLGDDQPLGGVRGLTRLLGARRSFGFGPRAPGALRAYQTWIGDAPSILAETESPAHSLFVLARAVGDFIAHGDRQACVADLYTDRQAVGRAFAAELIAPAEAVVRMTDDDELADHQIAQHFEAPVSAIRWQYNNNYRPLA